MTIEQRALAANFLSVSLVLVSAIGIAMASRLPARSGFVILLVCGAGMLAGAAIRDPHTSSLRVWLIAASLTLIGLAGHPLFEDDFFRYLWDGYRTSVAGTPYGVAPETFFAHDNLPEKFRQVLDRVNNPEVPTIYGPVLQSLFYLGHSLDPGNERVLRVFWSAANLALVGVLLRTNPPHRVALYAWNPLVFKEVCVSGHPDVVVPLLLCGGWLLRERLRGFPFAAAVGFAVATKVVALYVAVFLFRLRAPFGAIAIAIASIALCYLPFLLVSGSASELGGLLVFAERWKFNPGPLFVASEGWVGGFGVKAALGVAVGIAAVFIARRARSFGSSIPPWHWIFGLLLLASPVVNPWYLLWALPMAVATRELWPWVASWALLLSYATGENLAVVTLAPFETHPAAYGLQWGLIACALAWDLTKANFAARDSTAQ